ncbi:MAG: tetratricopeptide repeat protein [Taibaiella sp.]|nr:tetratricopeptide repeat protein [Taibaiella sp.]
MIRRTCLLFLLSSLGIMPAMSLAQSIKITPITAPGGKTEKEDGDKPENVEGEDIAETEEGRRAKTDELFFEALKAKQHADDEQAETLLKQFLSKRPEVAAAHYELAKIYSEQKKTEPAMASIKKALALDPQNKWYKEAKAGILIANAHYVEAAEIYGELAKADKQDDEYPVLAAEFYERAGKRQDAINYLDMALARNPGDEDIQVHKMQLYLNMNQVENAVTVVKQMITDDPKNGKYYKLLGEVYDNNNMTDKAAALYDDISKKMPDDPSIQLGQATHYLATGDTPKYRTFVRKAITNTGMETEMQIELLKAYLSTMPDEASALAEALPLVAKLASQGTPDAQILDYYAAALEGNNMPDSAAVIYKKALALKPSEFSLWVRLMGNYQEKKYADSLIKYSERAMRLFPNQAIAHFYNGVGYMNKGNYPSAIKAMNRALDLQPETEKEATAQIYSTLADVYYSSKQYTLSDQTFDKALELDPTNATVLNNYSYYLSERGIRLDDAEKMSKKSLELRPDEINFLDTYGWILYKKGDYNKSKTYIQKAISLANGNNDATLLEHLGDILYKLNDKSGALESWKKAKEKGSDGKNLDKKINEGKLYE